MTTPQDINAALDAFKMINRGPAESPNENEIMFNGFLLEKEVRIIEQILQSHAPDASPVDADQLKRESVTWYKERFDRSDIIGMPSDREVLFDFIDHLFARGFRQDGGKGDVSAVVSRTLIARDGVSCWVYKDGSHRGLNDADCEIINRALARCVPDDGGQK